MEEKDTLTGEKILTEPTSVRKKPGEISVQELMALGAQFAHSPRVTNSSMKPYIFDNTGKNAILNLEKTIDAIREAEKLLETAYTGDKMPTILWVDDIKTAGLAKDNAIATGTFYVEKYWGGLFTNMEVVKNSIKTHNDIKNNIESLNVKLADAVKRDNAIHQIQIKKKISTLETNLQNYTRYTGISSMYDVPNFIICIASRNINLIKEVMNFNSKSTEKKITIIAICDNNADCRGTIAIPSNDDKMGVVSYIYSDLVDTIIKGKSQIKVQPTEKRTYDKQYKTRSDERKRQ